MRFWFWDSVVLLQTLALAGNLLIDFPSLLQAAVVIGSWPTPMPSHRLVSLGKVLSRLDI